jgi:hypothetical protein
LPAKLLARTRRRDGFAIFPDPPGYIQFDAGVPRRPDFASRYRSSAPATPENPQAIAEDASRSAFLKAVAANIIERPDEGR